MTINSVPGLERKQGMVLRLLLCLLCFWHIIECQPGCQHKCHCKDHRITSGEFWVICKNVTDPHETLRNLPSQTTHLLFVLAVLEDTSRIVNVSFRDLLHLEVVLLDTSKGLSGLRLKMNRNALIQNSHIRVFRSRVPLYLEKDTFLPLQNLEEITLSETQMDWDFVPEMLHVGFSNKTKLVSLSLSQVSRYWSNSRYLAYFQPHKIFSGLRYNSIQQLDLSRNGIHAISPTFHRVFTKLQDIDLSYNMLLRPQEKYAHAAFYNIYLMWMEFCWFIPSMKHIDFSGQGKLYSRNNPYTANDFPNQISISNKSNVPPARYSSVFTLVNIQTTCSECVISYYSLSYHLCFCISLGGIKSISVTSLEAPETSKRTNIGSWTDIHILNNSVSYIDVSNNYKYHIANMHKLRIYGLDKLEYFNLQNNRLGQFSESFFKNFKSLKVLLLGGNDLYKSLNTSHSHLVLKENEHLEVIDLSFNGLTEITEDMFSNISSLRQLNLSHNSISAASMDLSLKGLHMLQSLNISVNRLSMIPRDMQKQLDLLNMHINRTLLVDLSNNPFLCSCDNLQFLHWFQTTEVYFYNGANYSCVHPRQGYITMKYVDLEELHNFCYFSNLKTIILSCAITAMVIIMCVVGVTIYCKRWRLRYWWYLTQKGWKQLTNNSEPTDYDHDVFVAYNWQDSPWVHGSLLREMEEKRGLNLCIHQRDFIPGEVLEELIVSKIQRSRKTLLVLSPHFVNSNWCHFELHMARSQLFDKGQDVLVLIILQPLPPGSINGTLYQLLKRKVYLEWPQDAEGHDLFWNKLADALAKDGKQCRPFD